MSIAKEYEVAKSLGRGDKTFPIERICGHKMTSKNETVFKVKWLGFPTQDSTFEPLSHLLGAPAALLQYVQASRKSFQRAMPSQETDSGATFSQAPRAFLRQCTTFDEFVPLGCEKICKIDAEVVYEQEGLFWLVRFWPDKDERKLVRSSLMHYYFPLESLLFLKKLNA